MTRSEMLEVLERVATEYTNWNIGGTKLNQWEHRFCHHSLKNWERIVELVLDTVCRPPSRGDFCRAEDELGLKPQPGRRDDWQGIEHQKRLKQYEEWHTDKLGHRKRVIGDAVAWERPLKMEVIEKAYGYRWINKQLGLSDGKACMAFIRLIREKPTENNRYKDWKDKAFKSAWAKLYGQEPSEEVMKQYA